MYRKSEKEAIHELNKELKEIEAAVATGHHNLEVKTHYISIDTWKELAYLHDVEPLLRCLNPKDAEAVRFVHCQLNKFAAKKLQNEYPHYFSVENSENKDEEKKKQTLSFSKKSRLFQQIKRSYRNTQI